MGGQSSKEDNSWSRQSSSSWNEFVEPQSSYYGQGSYVYDDPQHSYSSSHLYYDHSYSDDHEPYATHSTKLQRRYSRIADNYNSINEVTVALARAGLESSNLIVGVDFTKSNEWTGKSSFHTQSLHHIGIGLNPYEQAISIIGKTLAAFDEDNLIPCFGFGDASTHDQDVFSFYPDRSFCNGFEHVLSRYREIVPDLRLAGPTSFAPIIEMAMTIVEQSGGQYHVLVIIADGQFVNFTEITSKNIDHPSRKEAALMEIPCQYKAAIELNLLGKQEASGPQRVPLPPPKYSFTSLNTSKPSQHDGVSIATPSAPSSTYDHQLCPICLSNSKDMPYGCGHQTCCECGQDLQWCPICRSPINTRIKLY